jgi:type VI secretion system protein ImpK
MANGIDDPFAPRDATVIRPRPGGRRSSGELQPSHRAAAPSRIDHAAPVVGPEVVAPGLNPLVQAAVPLLLLAGQLRHTAAVSDVAGLRNHALDEVRRFEERARGAGVANEVVLAARYALCSTIDEAAMSTPWGAQSEWAEQTLLILLHREAWGGEKFFDMLSRTMPDPSRHIDLMELQYLCMAVGFAGKYHVAQRGQAQLADVERMLHRAIRDFRGTAEPALSPRWRGREDRRNPILRFVPWWVVGAAVLSIVSLTFLVFWIRLGGAATPVQAQLAGIGTEVLKVPTPAAPTRGPTLKQLLAEDESKGLLTIEEDGGRTTVMLSVASLFSSGSASVGADVQTTLGRIAAAIRRVPGRVIVVGHTDDQPIRSLQYADNYALSRARAESVADVLRAQVDVAGRIRSTGVGPSQPRFPDRARNRRVEIVHLAES